MHVYWIFYSMNMNVSNAGCVLAFAKFGVEALKRSSLAVAIRRSNTRNIKAISRLLWPAIRQIALKKKKTSRIIKYDGLSQQFSAAHNCVILHNNFKEAEPD